MQLYISLAERRVTVSVVGGKGVCAWEVMMVKGGSGQRLPYRSVLPTVLLLGILMPFLFIRTAFLALDAGAAFCPSIGCIGRRIGPLFFGGGDTSLQQFVMELRRAYEAEGGEPLDPKVVEDAPESWNDLMAETASFSFQDLDLRSFLLKTKAMLMKMDQKVQSARTKVSIYQHLASLGVPKNMHCLSLRLAEEYLVNAYARSSLPPPEYAYRLTNASYIHIALLTDNILGAAVAISSTVVSSAEPERLVFHVITDKKSYAAMHAWFALNSVSPAIVQVKGLHQFDWPQQVNNMIMEMAHEIRECLAAYQHHQWADGNFRRYEALSPSSFSLLNYLKIYLPELFPKLERLIFLDDDVVVRHDLSSLWEIDLTGLVIGAVRAGEGNGSHCNGRKFGDYLNFSNPFLLSLSHEAEAKQCAWLSGMNVFNLEAWRRTNITHTYKKLIKLNRESGFTLWHMGSLPPALVAFSAHMQNLDPSWHLPGLGWRIPNPELMETAAVLHFSGPQKPWLHIGFSELREVWRSHLNHSNELLRSCLVV